MLVMSPEFFVYKRVIDHPSMYGAMGYEKAKKVIFDHVFNVLGNGIDKSDIPRMFKSSKFPSRQIAKMYMDSEEIMTAYLGGKTIYLDDGEEFQMPSLDHCMGYYRKEEIDDYPEVTQWVSCGQERKNTSFVPYPNFQKKYSLAWSDEFKKFIDEHEDWKIAIVEYYQQCLEYFQDDDCDNTYSDAYPGTDPERTVRDLERIHRKYDSHEDFTESYGGRGIDYNGNMEDFCKARWIQEKKRIIQFIYETIEYLQS